ncbi:MAG: hypothetical protein ABS35_36220 [Kaistia sp. SCN 65-12]|jgi:tetratricopeptide (TPR) repeat protein|nr:MAG: hypothetical protein ABS35_36220 [Kaistia sp. SCN 65-12]
MNAHPGIGTDPMRVIESLSALAICKQGLPAYYRTLVGSSDQVLRVAAIAALLELKAIRPAEWSTAVDQAQFGAVRSRACDYFLGIFEYDLVEACLAKPAPDVGALRERRIRAALALANDQLFEIDLGLFIAEGTLDHLNNVRTDAEQLGGWQRALPWAARCILVQPGEPSGPYTLLNTLLNANQLELLAAACRAFRQADVYPAEVAIFTSFLLVKEGRAKEAQKLLQAVPMSGLDPRMIVVSLRAKAEAFERMGDHRQAYATYQRQNASTGSKDVDPAAYPRAILRHSQFKLEPLPSDERAANHLVMLGFPRSGTTLLENALAAHPLIETMEEVPALASAINYLEIRASKDRMVKHEDGMIARQRYYHEIKRHGLKTTAQFFVDKMPLHTAEVHLLEQLFPERRYIFSIRHPYDVILSCFKQLFKPNAAMENFRTIEDACRLYDFVMSRWFSVFQMGNSERVYYVRYEQLVEDFVPTVKGVLGFVGAQWHEEIMRFPELAAARPTRTPSYQKVRGGLSVGVQSTRAAYAFLFRRPETKVLDRWVEHFGYTE